MKSVLYSKHFASIVSYSVLMTKGFFSSHSVYRAVVQIVVVQTTQESLVISDCGHLILFFLFLSFLSQGSDNYLSTLFLSSLAYFNKRENICDPS